MTAPQNDNDPFGAPTENADDPFNEWSDLPGDCPTDSLRLDALEAATAADPFATSRLGNCLLAFGAGPSPFDRYQVANRRYLESALRSGDTPEMTELFRLIAYYWLGRARSILVD